MSLLIFIIGLLIGSFINCLAWRLPKKEPIFLARSHCPSCKKILSWLELIPIISFVIQKGRCRSCKLKISWQYPLVEITTAILFMLIYRQLHSNTLLLIFYLFITSILILIFLIDLKDGVILDIIIWPSAVIIFVSQIFFRQSWQGLILAAAIGASWFGLQYLISRGRWIGSGDIGLGLLMGVILIDWPQLLVALFLAYVSGAIIGVLLMFFKKKHWQSAIPFGVFLAPATFVTMLWGWLIIVWYFNLIGIPYSI